MTAAGASLSRCSIGRGVTKVCSSGHGSFTAPSPRRHEARLLIGMSSNAADDDQREIRRKAMTLALPSTDIGRAFAAPTCCPHCGDWLVAPTCSEFVGGGEIRHHWDCDDCSDSFCTTIEIEPVRLLVAEPAE
jgi:hypothetical protein